MRLATRSLLACLLGTAAVLMAQGLLPVASWQFNKRHASQVRANPQGIHFELRTADGRKRFRVGEPIPIELRFSSSIPRTYEFDAALYDRSGRMLTERFEVDVVEGRSGAYADPLEDFYSTGLLIGAAGGLRRRSVLDVDAESIPAYLNEWVRFDQPGRYRVYAKSFRVGYGDGDPAEKAPVVSGLLELEIVQPEAGWAAAQLTRPLGQVRFLNSPEALQILARSLVRSEEDYSPAMLGLAGARDRELAQTALEKELANPPGTGGFGPRYILAYLRLRQWFVMPLPSLLVYMEGPNYIRDSYASAVRRGYSLAYDAMYQRVLKEFPVLERP